MPTFGALSWLPFTLGLTGACLLVTWLAWRRWGLAAGVRGLALSLLPLAAYLTGLLQLVWRIGDAAAEWALQLAFSPAVWVGVGLLGLSAVLYAVSARLRASSIGTRRSPQAAAQPRRPKPPVKATTQPAAPKAPLAGPQQGAAAADEDFAEIEEILRRRGIS
jgi:hypothetical protein